MIQQPNFNYYSNPYFQNYNTPVIQQSQPVFNPIIPPSYNPDLANYYSGIIRQPMLQNDKDFRQKYYPDLTDFEYNMQQPQRNEYFYQNGRFEQLAKYGTFTNCGETYNKVKDNQNFKELINSKYLNSAQGFVKIINNLKKLEENRAAIFKPNPYAIVDYAIPPQEYAKLDMPDYLRMLNDFIKNEKLSDDIKKYFIYKKSDDLNFYYKTLAKLNKSENPIEILVD